MDRVNAVFRRYNLVADVKTLQDLDAALPETLRNLTSQSSAQTDPMSFLSDLYTAHSSDDIRSLVVSFIALLSAGPPISDNLFGVPENVPRGELLGRGLARGTINDHGLIASLAAECYDDDENGAEESALGAAVQWINARLMRLSPASPLPATTALTRAVLGITDAVSQEWLCENDRFRVLLNGLFSSPVLDLDQLSLSLPSKSDPEDPVPRAVKDAVSQRFYTALDSLVSTAHHLLLKLLKAPSSKILATEFLLDIANENRERLKMQFDPGKVCSDGAAVALLNVLLLLASPFSTPAARTTKEQLIESMYYSRYPQRLDISGFDRVLSSAEDHGNTISSGQQPPNFISDCFYLTLHLTKMSLMRALDDYYEVIRVLGDLRRAIGALPEGDDPRISVIRNKITADFSRLQSTRCHLEAMLLPPGATGGIGGAAAAEFIGLMMAHWLRLHESPDRKGYSELPEFYMECIGEWWIGVSRLQPLYWLHPIEPLSLFNQYAMAVLSDPRCCRSIHQRCRLVEVLFGWTVQDARGKRPLSQLFTAPDFDNLVPTLLRLYIDVEQTGSAAQFYEKFNIRYHLSSIIELLWDFPLHRTAIQKAAERPEFFLRFQNHLLNDCTYLLDESLMKLAELHRLETTPAGSNDQERAREIAHLERTLQSYIQLTNVTLRTLRILTADCRPSFARPEIVGRLAAMLLANLRQLVGQRCRELKVRDAQRRFHFEPKFLLASLVIVFLNMAGESAFDAAVRGDSRSFDESLFIEVEDVVRRTGCLEHTALDGFISVAKRIAALPPPVSSDLEADADPAFLDPLMFTLMHDPVILKTSKVTVDRSTIRAHLLNDPHDPFNRAPLAEADLEDDVELRERIQKWLQSKQ